MPSRDDGRTREARPDHRTLRERVARLRADERRYGGHTFDRHVDIGPAGTQARAQQIFTDSRNQVRHHPADVTRWTSDHALARAVDGVERSRQYRAAVARAEEALRRGEPPETIRPVIRIPLRDAMDADWRSCVAGHRADANGVRPTRFTDKAEVVAVYRARPGGGWRLHTCYPIP